MKSHFRDLFWSLPQGLDHQGSAIRKQDRHDHAGEGDVLQPHHQRHQTWRGASAWFGISAETNYQDDPGHQGRLYFNYFQIYEEKTAKWPKQ